MGVIDRDVRKIFQIQNTKLLGPLGHGAEKSFISEEVYRKYFSYRPRQKTKDIVTAQGCHFGRVELQIRIREFQETWEFHIGNNMQYQYILGIDFMESKLTLDFDQKSLIIPDDQIKQLPKVEKPVEIDLSDTKLEHADDGSANATVCEGWSQDFKLIDGLLFYAKYSTSLGELRVYIPKSLREAIMQELHDLPLAGHLGERGRPI
ncbi:hypothetical protein TNCV_2935761 [Trichonephila clavipes]|nr:hypothetical protein TNCV_2935761 [Trichonephila clavipes]